MRSPDGSTCALNVAVYKTAYQSTSWSPTQYQAGVAVDGSTNPATYQHTGVNAENPWWCVRKHMLYYIPGQGRGNASSHAPGCRFVDLGASATVQFITIYNRNTLNDNCCWKRLHDLEIRVGVDVPDPGTPGALITVNTICGSYVGPPSHVLNVQASPALTAP